STVSLFTMVTVSGYLRMMGTLQYGSPPATFTVPDRALAHMELVIVAKLRRGENFALTLAGDSAGRTTIWINSASVLRFDYDDDVTDISREWLDVLLDSA